MGKTRSKNSTIKSLSTLSVPCMKIQGGYGSPVPRCRRPCLRICVAIYWSDF